MNQNEEEEQDLLDLDQIDDLPAEEPTHPSNCLVGKLHSDKSVNSYALMDVMKKAWKPRKGFDAREWTNSLFLFRFENATEMEWVINNQPWHFEGNLFTIRPLKEKEQPSKIQISETHLWVRIYDAPLSCMNMILAKAMANKIGALVAIDSSQDFFGKYIRIKVSIDITKPLRRGLSVVVGGENLWLPIKYESLPLFCYNCGMIGHLLKSCSSLDHIAEHDPQDMPFGPDIKASPLKKGRPWAGRSDSSHNPYKPHTEHHSPTSSSSQSRAPSHANLNRNPKPLCSTQGGPRLPPFMKEFVTPLDQATSITQNSPIPQLIMDLDPPCSSPKLPKQLNLPPPKTPPAGPIIEVPVLPSLPSPHNILPIIDKPKSSKSWKKLARNKPSPTSQDPQGPARGKRPFAENPVMARDVLPEAKRLKFLNLSIEDGSTVEAAPEQPHRSK